MTTVKDVLGNLKEVNIPSLTAVVIKKNEKEIIRVNQQELSQGRNYLGQTVGTYSKNTELISKQTNPRQPKKAGQPYNFEDTGSLFDRMFLILRGIKLTINSYKAFGSSPFRVRASLFANVRRRRRCRLVPI